MVMNNLNSQHGWYKDTQNKKISGVCSGLAQRLNLPIWSTRLVMLLLLLSFPFVVALGYFIAHCCLAEKSY
jgi:phage shock protein C